MAHEPIVNQLRQTNELLKTIIELLIELVPDENKEAVKFNVEIKDS